MEVKLLADPQGRINQALKHLNYLLLERAEGTCRRSFHSSCPRTSHLLSSYPERTQLI
jgi:hypothetical protein